MGKWRIAGSIGFFIAVVLLLETLFLDPGWQWLAGAGSAYGNIGKQLTAQPASNPISAENQQLGTSKWMISQSQESSTQIQAYAGATSVMPGKSITFYVSVQKEGTPYTMSVYRSGWYGGDGAHLMLFEPGLIGHAQGYYNEVAGTLVDCASCYVDKKTGLVEANWQPSYALDVPSDWTTGIYLAKFSDVYNKETYATFDVLGNLHSRYVVVTPDTTSAAYNLWGGYSLYDAGSTGEVVGLSRGVKVSFDRPYLSQQGASQVLVYEIDAIRWLERQGYDLSYMSDIDLHEHPDQLLQHRAYISLGHDEYWTKEMRDGVEYARDHGVGLVFLGANAAYWQMRLAPDRAGAPDRTIVCYKVETGSGDLALDPFYGKDNSRLTALWRDPIIGRPENSLIGIMYSDLTHQRLGYPWQVSSISSSPLLEGTGLEAGQSYGCDLVGYEWDHIFANGDTPKGLQVIATSPTITDNNKPDFSNTTYYIAASGAFVFASGSIYWSLALDVYRFQPDNLCPQRVAAISSMQKLMAHVMDAVAVIHPTHVY